MYVIMGATGHTGSVITQALLKNKKPVRAISRSAEHLRPLVDAGAEAAIGDLTDSHFLADAMRNATAVYAIIPTDPRADRLRKAQQRVGEATIKAIRKAGVEYVVNLSSLGAQLRDKMGPVVGLHEQEERLNRLRNVNVLHLRAAYFMENLLGSIAAIRATGTIQMALRPDVAFPLISSGDIGQVAAARLQKLDFKGHAVQELRGPADLTPGYITEVLAKALDRPDLKYIQLDYGQAERNFIDIGFSADVARSYIEMNRSMNDGIGIAAAERTDETRTPTTFETFVSEVFVPAFKAAKG